DAPLLKSLGALLQVILRKKEAFFRQLLCIGLNAFFRLLSFGDELLHLLFILVANALPGLGLCKDPLRVHNQNDSSPRRQRRCSRHTQRKRCNNSQTLYSRRETHSSIPL